MLGCFGRCCTNSIMSRSIRPTACPTNSRQRKPVGTLLRSIRVGFLPKAGKCTQFEQTVRKLDAGLITVAQRNDFRDFFCSARPQAAKLGQLVMCRGVFARSARLLHRESTSI